MKTQEAAAAPPARISSNVIANYAGRVWSIGLALALTPLYLKWLGLEAYGLVGLYATIQSILTWLDVGISPTLARALAQLSARDEPQAKQDMRDLVTTFGLSIGGIGALAGLLLVAVAPLATRWVSASSLSATTVTHAVMLMGLNVALQWPTGLLQGGLMALERQVQGNLVSALASTLRAAITLCTLLLLSRRIELFFLGQALGAGLGTAATALLLSRCLPSSATRGRFRKDLFVLHWRFAAGMTGTAVTTVLATQVDNLALSRFVPLAEFGSYSLARTISNSISNISSALVSAFYPRYCKQVEAGSSEGLAAFYHLTAQAMSVLCLSTCLTVAAFAPELVFLWTGDLQMSLKVAPALRLLAFAGAIQSTFVLPYYLQLAHGWTRLTLTNNLLTLALTAPVTLFLAWRYGAVGAAASSIVFNLLYASFYIPRMHRQILPAELRRWLTDDILSPAAGAAAVVVCARLLWPAGQQRWAIALGLALVGGCALVSSAALSRRVRALALRKLRALPGWSA